jgi:WD40 repeat protein
VVASVGGDADGLWRFDPETLEPTPITEVPDRTPIGVASSLDHERWYTAWGTGNRFEGSARKVLAAFNPTSGRIMKRASVPGSFKGRAPLLYEPVNDHLVVFDLDGSAQFFDAATLELEHELSVGPLEGAAVAPERGDIYFGVSTESGPQIRVYDPTEAKVTRTISLPDKLGLSDLTLSPDKRYCLRRRGRRWARRVASTWWTWKAAKCSLQVR